MSDTRTGSSSANPRKPSRKDWLINLMQALGYEANEQGVCFGIASMGLQAMLASDVASFDARIQALRNAWSELSPLFNTTAATEKAKEALLNQLVKRLFNFNNKQHMDKYHSPSGREGWVESDHHKAKQQIKADILAFFDGIQLYQSPSLYLHLAAKASQDVLSNSPLVMSKALEEKGKLFRIPLSVGTYTQANLESYLDSLESQIVKDATRPFAFMICSPDHAIMLGYDPENKDNPWCLIDANQLPPRYFSSSKEKDMAAMLYQAFDLNRNALVSISVTLYGIEPTESPAIEPSIKLKLSDPGPFQALHYAASINPADNATTLLLLAARDGNLGVIKALLDAYAKIDQLVNGYTPLYAAARNGHLEIVQALLKAGASVNKANHLGETPLYIAAENGHVKIVRTLIEAGADVNVPDNKGLTPLQAARTYQPQAEGGDYKEIIDVLSQASSSCPPRPQ